MAPHATTPAPCTGPAVQGDIHPGTDAREPLSNGSADSLPDDDSSAHASRLPTPESATAHRREGRTDRGRVHRHTPSRSHAGSPRRASRVCRRDTDANPEHTGLCPACGESDECEATEPEAKRPGRRSPRALCLYTRHDVEPDTRVGPPLQGANSGPGWLQAPDPDYYCTQGPWQNSLAQQTPRPLTAAYPQHATAPDAVLQLPMQGAIAASTGIHGLTGGNISLRLHTAYVGHNGVPVLCESLQSAYLGSEALAAANSLANMQAQQHQPAGSYQQPAPLGHRASKSLLRPLPTLQREGMKSSAPRRPTRRAAQQICQTDAGTCNPVRVWGSVSPSAGAKSAPRPDAPAVHRDTPAPPHQAPALPRARAPNAPGKAPAPADTEAATPRAQKDAPPERDARSTRAEAPRTTRDAQRSASTSQPERSLTPAQAGRERSLSRTPAVGTAAVHTSGSARSRAGSTAQRGSSARSRETGYSDLTVTRGPARRPSSADHLRTNTPATEDPASRGPDRAGSGSRPRAKEHQAPGDAHPAVPAPNADHDCLSVPVLTNLTRLRAAVKAAPAAVSPRSKGSHPNARGSTTCRGPAATGSATAEPGGNGLPAPGDSPDGIMPAAHPCESHSLVPGKEPAAAPTTSAETGADPDRGAPEPGDPGLQEAQQADAHPAAATVQAGSPRTWANEPGATDAPLDSPRNSPSTPAGLSLDTAGRGTTLPPPPLAGSLIPGGAVEPPPRAGESMQPGSAHSAPGPPCRTPGGEPGPGDPAAEPPESYPAAAESGTGSSPSDGSTAVARTVPPGESGRGDGARECPRASAEHSTSQPPPPARTAATNAREHVPEQPQCDTGDPGQRPAENPEAAPDGQRSSAPSSPSAHSSAEHEGAITVQRRPPRTPAKNKILDKIGRHPAQSDIPDSRARASESADESRHTPTPIPTASADAAVGPEARDDSDPGPEGGTDGDAPEAAPARAAGPACEARCGERATAEPPARSPSPPAPDGDPPEQAAPQAPAPPDSSTTESALSLSLSASEASADSDAYEPDRSDTDSDRGESPGASESEPPAADPDATCSGAQATAPQPDAPAEAPGSDAHGQQDTSGDPAPQTAVLCIAQDDRGRTVLRCPLCDRAFAIFNRALRHLEAVHAVAPAPHPEIPLPEGHHACPVCHERLAQRKAFKTHLAEKHPGYEPPEPEPRRERRCPPARQPPLICHECLRQFACRAALLTHCRALGHNLWGHSAHVRPEADAYQCPACAQWFPRTVWPLHRGRCEGLTDAMHAAAAVNAARPADFTATTLANVRVGLVANDDTAQTRRVVCVVAELALHEQALHAWDSVETLDRLLVTFHLREPALRGAASIERKVASLVRRGFYGRAYEAIQRGLDMRQPENLAETLRALHPRALPHPAPEESPQRDIAVGLEPLSEEDIAAAINGQGKLKAPGPSGLNPVLLKELAKNALVLKVFAGAFNAILLDPAEARRCPALFGYRIIAIPKGTDGFRPIALGECLLTVLHRLLARRLVPAFDLAPEQLCFRQHAAIRAHAAVLDMIGGGRTLVSADIANAFGSVPQDVLLAALQRSRAHPGYLAYARAFLAARHSPLLGHHDNGTPQGDPLSMLLFAAAVDPVVRETAAACRTVAYADDMLLGVPRPEDAGAALDSLAGRLRAIGLLLNRAKCTVATDTAEVSFMGRAFTARRGLSLAPALREKLAEEVPRLLAQRGITEHARLRMLALCTIPAVNYGPFLEEESSERAAEYAAIDDALAAAVAAILGVDGALARELLLAPYEQGGLGAVLPGVHFGAFARYRDEVLHGTRPVFKRLRAEAVQPPPSWLCEQNPRLAPFAATDRRPLSAAESATVCASLRPAVRALPVGPCPFCGHRDGPDHAPSCAAQKPAWVARHDAVLAAIVRAGPSLFFGAAGGRDADGQRPDLVLRDGRCVDATVVREDHMGAAYREKVHKYSDRYAETLPVVLSTTGALYGRSAEHLDQLFRDPVVRGVLRRSLARTIIAAQARAEANYSARLGRAVSAAAPSEALRAAVVPAGRQ